MKIEQDLVEEITLEYFADRHNLTMKISDRGEKTRYPRYYAQFKDSSISEPPFLSTRFGDGDSPEEAIKNYAQLISETTLVIEDENGRRDIEVPILREKT